ncbi:hypothetical protein HJC23_001388 [Cyclotella cryptica]|uniref:SET domain-containing protein n=1 Tax=Cyclotella cryptica TaxID=29204 RepID=A0ABD3P8M8_9STRA|eukprot:CCRYP_016715-RA/>CCRYP_016715-RA protein AED:0.11 eAED:0.11 QI:0/-1/0/1/-1/1/1/0/457
MKTLRSYTPLVLGALIEECWTFHGVHSFHSPVSFHRRHTIQHDASSATLPMAKSKTATKKKKGVSVSGLRGFGSPSSTSTTTTSGGVIDRSKSALLFYDFLEVNGGGSNLKRVGLGQVPLPGTDCSIRGVIALQDIRKGDPIIEIPYEMALDFGRENADPTLPATSFLQMYCQWKSGGESGVIVGGGRRKKIGDYFAMLPPYQCSDCLGSTDFFSDTALEMMQSPLIVEETLSRRKLVKARFERDIETMAAMSSNLYRWKNGEDDDSEIATFSHLQWATWLVTSRVLTVQARTLDGTVPHRLFIPFIDMCNHDRDSPHILSGRAEPGGMLKVIAGADVKAGEAIDISYGGGVEGNDRFIQDYGFLDSGGSMERASGRAVAEAYRVVAKKLLSLGKQSSRIMSRISVADQERALEALKLTSLEEDERLLSSGKVLNNDERMALEYRIGLKRAIQEVTG